jgi:hypothetical protein
MWADATKEEIALFDDVFRSIASQACAEVGGGEGMAGCPDCPHLSSRRHGPD